MKKKRNLPLFDGCYYSLVIVFDNDETRFYYCDYYDDISTIVRTALDFDTKSVKSINIRLIEVPAYDGKN